ncbi:MAG: gamma-glutamyl-gamma-aminobutyrate hydrolase family protein [Gammaproteobacteria bacterium]|nr:gamma-glutamyl-gamma-aminobutyrate hydrolase family protein [Gammaproteobacteria bacterium]NNC56944.1 gamma-glutamyl-gamma-aminobutyrate hydrolase family protein [Woeseiaceae bacterium]NNL49546.1 gamma-glutamyl-gamma-aminobutyrate hydrolase family protein [Woeseiaceae bacterium]
MSPNPLIGVPADRRVLDPHPFQMVGEKYLKALTKGSEALPLIMPVMADDVDIDELLGRFDGIFLTGSYSNVEPHHYDGDPSAEGTLHDPHRDAMTLPLARRALETGVPVLAVCRGFQELNVALGGTLHQKVHEVAGYHNHLENKDDPLEKQYGPSHPVNLVDGGLLRGLAGVDTVMVNSLHAQGVAQLAPGVCVEAVADDGLIEAFRVDDVPGFALAVQWHPEWQVMQNEFSKVIFKAFGDACRVRAGRRQV